ncbi:MAG: BlaI/MecI/CopY family transcriptional regulator [Phycisphaerales bacterium]|nr:MAG: BlaI/MecI/CopY family transcriptional regulator [Phycisphaerales bacterium]
MQSVKPSDLEMQILSVLWEKGASTAREVLESMPDGKHRAYTSILSVMQVMEKKGLLKHTNRGVAHVYSPAVNRKKIIQPFIHKVVNEVFGGRPSAMMQALLTETPVSDDEVAQIRMLLEQARSQRPTETAKQEAK